MDDRILSGALFVVLSAVFGRHGIGALPTAYSTGDRTAWTEQAIQGGLGVTTPISRQVHSVDAQSRSPTIVIGLLPDSDRCQIRLLRYIS